MSEAMIQLRNQFDDEHHGSIILSVPGEAGSMVEMLRLAPLGDDFVRGEEVDNNQRVYQQFRNWLDSATASRGV